MDFYERTDDPDVQDRLSYATVLVGNTPASTDPIQNTLCYTLPYVRSQKIPVACGQVITGQYVIVYKPREVDFASGWNIAMHMNEVDVYTL